MATHSVNILIKARDQASKKFLLIGASSKVMGAALKAMSSGIRRVFTGAFAGIAGAAKMAFRGVTAIAKRAFNALMATAKRVSIGIAAAFGYSIYAAMKQQAAEIELASALKMAGTYSDALMQKLKQQASEVQKDTVYGDEYVLTLMRMAKTLGWSEDKLTDVAKAAIALYAGFGGGRGKPEIFLRYYTDAVRGTSKSLDTYVGELRKAKTEEERQAILQKNIARGWDVAKSKTDSAKGSLAQMKNALGDVAEAIGEPFLADITRTAHAIKGWAVENEDAIALFAEKVHSYVTLAKDIFIAYVNFMKKDWKEGFHRSLDATIVLFRAWGQSLKVVMEKIFMDIGANITTWLYNAMQWRAARKFLIKNIKEEEGIKSTIFGGIRYGGGQKFATKGEADLAQKRIEKEAERILQTYGPEASGFELKKTIDTKSWDKLGKDIKGIWKDALSQAGDIMPDFANRVNEAFSENEKRLAELKVKLAEKGKSALAPEPGPELQKEGAKTEDVSKSGLAAIQARFLTFAPGTQFDYQHQTANGVGQMVRQQNKIIQVLEKIEKGFAKTNVGLEDGTVLVSSDFT